MYFKCVDVSWIKIYCLYKYWVDRIWEKKCTYLHLNHFGGPSIRKILGLGRICIAWNLLNLKLILSYWTITSFPTNTKPHTKARSKWEGPKNFLAETALMEDSPPVDLYFISEKSIWKNQVRRTGFLVYFKLDFYCLCSLQNQI